ncbi:MAG: tyrosine-type recombinase/integrase [Pirellulaceae bacterium]
MAKSIRKSGASKPEKPRPDFPLFPHDTGRWAKKIRGKLHYFGPWAEPEAALNLYLDQREDLHAGRQPRVKRDGFTVEEACNQFLHARKTKVDSGELSRTTWHGYQLTAKQVVKKLGRKRLVEDLRGEDFDALRVFFAKTNGLVGLKNKINHTRIIFKYAYDAELIDRPVRFGANFKRPSAQSIRRQRTPRMFEAAEIRTMLDNAGPTMKAMLLLGCNCGFGCTDVATLPISAIDRKTGWVTFPRPKTGSERRVPLWPETLIAIDAAIVARPKPAPEHKRLLFITRTGESFAKDSTRYVSDQFRKFIEPLGLHKTGRGFYALRHVFETIGGESRDQVAVDAIMGHERGEMAAHYRERISDDRLEAVVEVVRTWLFSKPVAHDDHPDVIQFRTVG